MRRVLATVLVLVLSFNLAACGNSTGDVKSAEKGPDSVKENTEASVKTIQLGHGQTEAHPYHLGAVKFAELVDQYTDGQIKVEIFPNATLGAERDMVEGLVWEV